MATIREGLLAEYDHEMATTRRLLDRLPEDKLAWKPHEKSRSLGELGCHLATLPRWGTTILNGAFYDLDIEPEPDAPASSRADMLSRFDAVTAEARAALDKTDAEYLARWSLRRGGQELFSMPRVTAFRTFVLYHLVHHRGQLTVYLRLNDVPVPAIYGPTADEG